jgi:hypothetical protein
LLFLGEEATIFVAFASRWYLTKKNKSEDAGGRGPPYRVFLF